MTHHSFRATSRVLDQCTPAAANRSALRWSAYRAEYGLTIRDAEPEPEPEPEPTGAEAATSEPEPEPTMKASAPTPGCPKKTNPLRAG